MQAASFEEIEEEEIQAEQGNEAEDDGGIQAENEEENQLRKKIKSREYNVKYRSNKRKTRRLENVVKRAKEPTELSEDYELSLPRDLSQQQGCSNSGQFQ